MLDVFQLYLNCLKQPFFLQTNPFLNIRTFNWVSTTEFKNIIIWLYVWNRDGCKLTEKDCNPWFKNGLKSYSQPILIKQKCDFFHIIHKTFPPLFTRRGRIKINILYKYISLIYVNLIANKCGGIIKLVGKINRNFELWIHDILF